MWCDNKIFWIVSVKKWRKQKYTLTMYFIATHSGQPCICHTFYGETTMTNATWMVVKRQKNNRMREKSATNPTKVEWRLISVALKYSSNYTWHIIHNGTNILTTKALMNLQGTTINFHDLLCVNTNKTFFLFGFWWIRIFFSFHFFCDMKHIYTT